MEWQLSNVTKYSINTTGSLNKASSSSLMLLLQLWVLNRGDLNFCVHSTLPAGSKSRTYKLATWCFMPSELLQLYLGETYKHSSESETNLPHFVQISCNQTTCGTTITAQYMYLHFCQFLIVESKTVMQNLPHQPAKWKCFLRRKKKKKRKKRSKYFFIFFQSKVCCRLWASQFGSFPSPLSQAGCCGILIPILWIILIVKCRVLGLGLEP